MAWPSKDHRDYLDDVERPEWHNRKGAPATLSSAAGGVGIVIGLLIGWLTPWREAPLAVIGGFAGVLGFDFYWRFVRESLPRKGSRDRHV
jgi:hypothetical protein